MKVRSICLGPLSTNSYLVEFGGKRILIDPAEGGDPLRMFVGEEAPDVVLNTHGHFDHTGGDWEFPGAEILIHAADVPLLDQAYPGHPPIGRTIADGEEIAPGLKVIHTPGHSPGSIVLCGEGVLFVGDLLFAGSIGRTDFPGGSEEDMRRSLLRVSSLPGDYLIYPGHGPATTLERERRENPFLVNLRG